MFYEVAYQSTENASLVPRLFLRYLSKLLKVAIFLVKHRFQSHLNCARSQASERLGTRLGERNVY